MIFSDFFRGAKNRIIIVGTNPLIPDLEQSASFFLDLLTLEENLMVTILCESDSENFAQSLCIDAEHSGVQSSFSELVVHRNRILGSGEKDGLLVDISYLGKQELSLSSILDRISVRQINLRAPVNMIIVDSTIWWCITGSCRPTIDSYSKLTSDMPLYKTLFDLADFYTNKNRGAIYNSKKGEELIQMFDREGYPRGIYPRSCFYTTEFERYSIWGFAFNRKGELLLHQRSFTAKDGRGLWDKSVGGHVDLRDSSTYITAQRELVEEMFLPEAEYSKYVRADLGDIIHFGEWNPKKRPERALKFELAGLGKSDWVMFRALDERGEPLTVTRISDRRIHDESGDVSIKRTVFRSDVYLFIAPPNYIENEMQMDRLFGLAEKAGAAKDHRLIPVDGLRAWIAQTEREGKDRETFTDDMLYIIQRHRNLLVQFSEFIKYIGGEG